MTETILPESFEKHLVDWATTARRENRHHLSKGYQGQVLLYRDEKYQLVVKVPPRWWPYSWLSARMLRHEARVYERLQHIDGIPRCYGLLNNRFLVLDFIEGDCLREASLRQREKFYETFLGIIRRMHARGVGHADLKRKDNILVTPNDQPYLIDFGVATLRRRGGWHPINNFLFNVARRFDLNAWVKHKYRRRLEDCSPRDQRYLHRTWMERSGRWIKRQYRRLTGTKMRNRSSGR
ncbi:putative Ser/Thr protein kinase [Natronospira proteinivora]|uniref:Ser/Thr protein kinase n=1 Tax=Natronospira proteinivora TaxID=1807133 RepID=A0ABT1G783_9GAMM|nr:hypothetical protein [Natronospira proteinivora]MCP1727161.1 putative Ser/Thr protein kinase [Natronospira proteinivora]